MVLHPLHNYVLWNIYLCGALLLGVAVRHICSVPTQFTPLSLRWLLLFFAIGERCKKLEVCPHLEFGGLSAPLPDVFVKFCRLLQKRDTFWNHHGVGNSMPSWSCKLPPIFDLVDEAGKRFCWVIGPHHLDYIFFEVNFVNHPVQPEEMLQHL